ncbi:AraC family transcriptional regulator [Herbidospora sp. NBRC 101105]|uniref:helix-turn-helix transcriptional regulator n=1 Tax=Herbidospora sp. NBRC 101105 TaxID=3032195 RepID=UPI0024A0E2FD|nr:AraC family transcriptional regulator [Herbidospora sp. NBRC 101105]GLX97120.1 transcriptional regulator [Herbidospora sp. NBRC 101105]
MVRTGHAPIVTLPYRAGVGVPPGVEVLDFPGLLARAHGHGVDPYSLRRPGFHVLIALRSGTLRCSLDFADHVLGPGDWLWVRPGQVQRYDSPLDAEGRIVLFLPGFLDRATAERAGADLGVWRPASVPADAERGSLRRLLDLLEHEYTAWDGRDGHVAVLRHLLAALVVRLADVHGADGGPVAGGEAFLRFRSAVERDFTRSHRVEDYAAGLGYSVRTLTRASRAGAGVGAKGYIDDRVLLEAKRLLVHTDLPAGVIGLRLGFPEATVFTKFFRRHTGRTPTAFRLSSGS